MDQHNVLLDFLDRERPRSYGTLAIGQLHGSDEMTMTIVIRAHDPNDPVRKPELRAFFQQCWNETYCEQLGEAVTATMIRTLTDDSVGGLMPGEDETVLIAEKSGAIIGTCIIAARGGVTYLWGLYVRQAEQRQGLGQRLLSQVTSGLRSIRCLEVQVLEASVAAHRFYEKAGFKAVRKSGYELSPGQTAPVLVMQKVQEHESNRKEVESMHQALDSTSQPEDSVSQNQPLNR